MSPSTKSKSKDKLAARAVKEQIKTSLKPTPAPANNGNGIPGSAYNPLSGTFHALDTEPSASLPVPKTNGRFRTIDEPEDHSGSSSGTTAEYDSLSNNDSCSGESEDPKEKTTVSNAPRKETIPGSDTDKRDKIRQKNEKKHQRQKEKRALEIHERCNGYLMSRKLEGLAQKLEAMGFSSEQATMALILNEGRVEESVAWLFEVGEDNKQQCATNLEGANIKIDITEELAQIETLEIKYKCSKLEVERAVVAFEGNLEKAEDSLKTLKQEPTTVPPKSEKSGNGVAVASALNNKVVSSVQIPVGKAPLKGAGPISIQQHRREERDFNYTKPVAAVVQIESGNKNLQPFVQVESTNRNLQPSRKILVKQDVTKPQVTTPVDKRWSAASTSPSFPYSPVPPLQEVVKPEARYPGAAEAKTNMQTPRLKEPIVVMQRPVSNPPKQSIYAGGRYVNVMSDSERELFRMVLEEESLKRRLGDSPSMKSVTQLPYAPSAVKPPSVAGFGGPWSTMGPPSTRTLSSLATPLGLFAGRGFSGSSVAADWSTSGTMPQCDYEKVDWSLDTTPVYTDWSLDSARQMPSTMKSNNLYDTPYLGAKGPMPAVNGGVCLGGLQEGRCLVTDPPNSVGSLEWTSPFNGMDLLRAPRQFVKSPSL